MGEFIDIDVKTALLDPETAQKLVALCPVEIYEMDNEALAVRPDQVDECTLCELCLVAAPARAIFIRKRYNNEQLVSRGGDSAQDEEGVV